MEVIIKNEFRKIALVLNNYVSGRAGEAEASTEIIEWILIPTRTSKQVVFMVSELFMSLYEGKTLPSKLTRSWLILTTLEGLSRRPNLVLDEAWVYVLIWLFKYSEDFEYDRVDAELMRWIPLVSSTLWVELWNWLIDAICIEELCPYPYLRLELFRLGHIFNQNFITLHTAPRIMEALVNIFSSFNDCDQLFSAVEDKLLCTPSHILPFLNWSQVRDHLINMIVADVDCLLWPTNKQFELCGKYIRFFVNLLKFISKSADISMKKYKLDGNKLRKSLNHCILLFIFGFNTLSDFNTFTMSEFHAVYRHPMVKPHAMNALATISDASLYVSSLINSRPKELSVDSEDNRNEIDAEFSQLVFRRHILLNKLLKRRDYIINILALHGTTKCFTHYLVKREMNGYKEGFREDFERKACQQLMFDRKTIASEALDKDDCSTFDFVEGDEDEKYIDETIDFGSLENEEIENGDMEELEDEYVGGEGEEEEEDEGETEDEDSDESGDHDDDIIEIGSEDSELSEDESEYRRESWN